MSIRIRPLRADMSGFVTGVARLLDFSGALHARRRHYRPELPPGLADYLAVQADWMATGQDIRQAVNSGSEQPGILPPPAKGTEQ